VLLPWLEHLTLESFELEDSDFFSELGEIVCCKNKGLREVVLEKVKREKSTASCEKLIKLLKDIIHKPTMKKFCYLDAQPGLASDFKGLEVLSLFDDVRKEVHHFDHLHLLSYTCEPTFYYWNLSWHKWTENLD